MAWIDLTGLGKYHEKIKAWIEKNKYVHPANHPATMIIQDNLNQFVSKEQKDKWNNKLDADANAVSASKLYKAVRINGVLFDGTKDINFDITSAYVEKSYVYILPAKTTKFIIPEQYWISEVSNILYVNGLKLTQEKHYTIDLLEHSITLNEAYDKDADIEVIFTGLDRSNTFSYLLEPNVKTIKLETSKHISKDSIIHVYVDGIKLIFAKHYTIDYDLKTINLIEGYENKIDVEILLLKE